MIIWIIGLSGAGKTTLGKSLYNKIRKTQENTIFLDGDIFRKYISNDLSYSVEDRKTNAYRQFNLCRMLDSQGINVVCCILSNQTELQELKRKEFKEYFEVYLNVSMDTLKKRDPKGLYKKAFNGEISNVVGVDIEFNPPSNPNLIIDNNEFFDVDSVTDEIIEKISQLTLDQLTEV